ncbi:glycosyltransferase family 2 protein [Mariniflexile sp. AS56]|uniref:glycosyltransferase family 2 protein n=1 Tax=Mariniflexile sp. AS56 TaxID=3063957 RepID=UPI0026EF1C82|nr:glycosyltransferase [Mariniflexile sp. AS56]MDO7171367.1 glycosyltransferase [Mariniflexile sp. AS56]
MIKLSIIVPVYNVDQFVERCVLSITNQDIPENEYEIILINDGSTDNSLEVITRLSKNYSNIIIHDQKNTGLGGARNKGLELAKGTYVWFIDSDDFITPNSLKELLSSTFDNNLDCLSFSFNCTDEAGQVIDWIHFKPDFNGKSVITGSEFYSNNYHDSYLCFYFFKRSIFLDHKIYFEQKINMQDSEIMPRIMNHVNRIMHLDKIIYSYVKRETSFINNNNSTVREKYYYSIIAVNDLLTNFKSSLQNNDALKLGLEKKLVSINKILFLQFLYNDFDTDTLNQIIKKLKQSKLYPFKSIAEQSKSKKIIYNTLRPFINKYPITSRNIYLKLRK